MRLSIPGVPTPDLASFEGHTIYYGGQGGFALGYRYVFFAFELTLAEISGTGDVKTAPDPRDGGGASPATREPRRLHHLSHLRPHRRILSRANSVPAESWAARERLYSVLFGCCEGARL